MIYAAASVAVDRLIASPKVSQGPSAFLKRRSRMNLQGRHAVSVFPRIQREFIKVLGEQEWV